MNIHWRVQFPKDPAEFTILDPPADPAYHGFLLTPATTSYPGHLWQVPPILTPTLTFTIADPEDHICGTFTDDDTLAVTDIVFADLCNQNVKMTIDTVELNRTVLWILTEITGESKTIRLNPLLLTFSDGTTHWTHPITFQTYTTNTPPFL